MSKYRIERSPLAERDLIEIWRYIAQQNVFAADGVLKRIDRQIERLRTYPRIGAKRDEISPGLRGLTASRYVILYDIIDERRTVTILRVIHMARDLHELFL